MDTILIILGILMLLGGLAGCILPGLPGPPLSYVGLLLFHWSSYSEFSTFSLIMWGVAMVIITIIDFLITPWMTKRFGGSKAANWGSIIGLIIGFFFPFPFGVLLGPFVGAFIGEIAFSKNNTNNALRAASGAFLSFFVGTGIKLIVSIGMIIAVISSIWQSF